MLFVVASNECMAQEEELEQEQPVAKAWSRAGKLEIYGLVQFMGGDTARGEQGVTVELDDTVAGGFGGGYNFSDYLNLNSTLWFSSADYKESESGTIPGGWYSLEVTGDASLFGWDVNLDYNILKSRLTPMATVGIGLINVSPSGFQSETEFSYNLGAGLRWDATDHLLVKVLYKPTWTDLEHTSTFQFDGVSVSIGFIF